jgi:hypothetical protein
MLWMSVLLVAASITGTVQSNVPRTNTPVAVRPGAPAPVPPPVRPPSIPDRLGEIAAALEGLNFSSGGGVTGPLGRNCVEARERVRWSNMPCSPDHLPPVPLVEVDDPY